MKTEDKFAEEFNALNSLAFYFENKLHNFKKDEEPDFWNLQDNIGLEVTQTNYDGEQIKILQQLHGKNYTYKQACEVLKNYDKRNKFRGELGRTTPNSEYFYTSPTKGMVDTCIYFDNIIKTINEKTAKLQGYKHFDTNFLFIADFGFTIEDCGVKNYMLPKIIEIEKSYKIVYDGYFIKQRNYLSSIVKHTFNKY